MRPAGVTQLVEYQLPKLKVAGSSPVARSMKYTIPIMSRDKNHRNFNNGPIAYY